MKPLMVILILASAITFLLSGFYFIESWRFTLYSEQTKGKIISFVSQPSLNSIRHAKILSYPVISFQTKEGQKVSFTSKTGFYPRSHHIGDTIDILYHPHNLQHTTIGYYPTIWLKFFATFFAGIVLAVLAYISHKEQT